MLKRIKRSPMETFSRIILAIVLLLSVVATLYPFIYVLSMSFSDQAHVIKRDVFLLPKGFTLSAYKSIMTNKYVWSSYYNTIWYTVVGTIVNVVMTVLAAYPLSRTTFVFRRFISLMITFTMFVSGGMIPFFIILTSLKLYNTRWALIIPFAVSAWNIIIARSFYETLPESLAESAKIDGANDIRILVKIMLPLSMPILAVISLFSAVGYWNTYFWAMVLLPNASLQPLQIYLYKLLIVLRQDLVSGLQIGVNRAAQAEQMKYAAIIVTVLPILFIYPFLQKYFVQGVMIGSIKG
jgi:putative aldouronate transport system permease protein